MNITVAIILIVIAVVAGIFLGKVFLAKKNSAAQTIIDAELSKNNSEKKLEEQLSTIKSQLTKVTTQLANERESNASLEQKADALESKYKSLLDEANKKIKDLDVQLKGVLDGNVDDNIKQQLAEITKLKKKIRELEDENEEFEDDLDSYKKKLKNKEQDFENLNIDFDKLKRESKQREEDLKNLSDQFEMKQKELDLKVESLAFIQEVLTATKSNDNSVSHSHTIIDNICDFISGELKDSVCSIYNLSDEVINYLFKSGLDSWALTAKKSWIQGKTSVAFVGEFSAGKTSIVNRILSQDDPNVPLLPVSTKATTAIPTYISGGVGTMYRFVTPNNELKNISEPTFKRVNKEVLDQVKGVSSLIQYFVMTYKNQNLDHLSILDTPGFNSNDKEDAERTIGVINECDALFWVFDVNAGTVNRSSINLIKQHLTKPLYVVINKVDTKAKSEVDKVEALIKKTLSDAGQKVEGFIRFSAKAPLEDIMKPIHSIKHDVEKENYINTLQQTMEVWVKEQEKEAVKAKQTANNLSNTCNSITNKYNIAIKELTNDCEHVAGIPQYEEHWYKKDNYEMSQEDFDRMIHLLEKISTSDCDKLCNLYNKMKETSEKTGQAYENWANEKEQWQRINSCLDILKKKIKNLKGRNNDRM